MDKIKELEKILEELEKSDGLTIIPYHIGSKGEQKTVQENIKIDVFERNVNFKKVSLFDSLDIHNKIIKLIQNEIQNLK